MNLPNDSTKFSNSVVRRNGRGSIILVLSFINLPFQLILQPNFGNAEVAELVDAHDSKSCSFGSVGSIPTFGTLKSF